MSRDTREKKCVRPRTMEMARFEFQISAAAANHADVNGSRLAKERKKKKSELGLTRASRYATSARCSEAAFAFRYFHVSFA